MIKVFIEKNEEEFNKITISGHAMFDDYGKDIVCSAVSSIVITTVNGIVEIDRDYLTVEEEKDKMTIIILKSDEICHKLILNMLMLLDELSKNYPKNIMVK